MVKKRPRSSQHGGGQDGKGKPPGDDAPGGTPPEPNEEEHSPWEHFPPQQRAFLAALAITYRVCDATRAARCPPYKPYEWRIRSPAFRKAMERALKMAADVIESEAVTRAVIGVQRKRFYKGQPIIDPETGSQYVEYIKSDYLMGRLLDATKPRKYRQRTEINQNTHITSEAPQQGQGIVAYMRERALAAVQDAVPKLPHSLPPAGSNGNGNGKPHFEQDGDHDE